jgi:hypothetical protein
VTRVITQKVKQRPTNNKTKPTTNKVKPTTNKVKPTTNKDPRTINQGQERVNKVALLIPSSHMVNLLLYHHCIWDFIPLVVMSFFKEGHVPSSFTPRSETKDQPMPQA